MQAYVYVGCYSVAQAADFTCLLSLGAKAPLAECVPALERDRSVKSPIAGGAL